MSSDQNETYAGGGEVGSWQTLDLTRRTFPKGNFHSDPNINFSVLPDYIADEFYVQVSDLSEVLVDYYVEAEDSAGNIKRSPIQHVWVGEATGSPGHVIDGDLDTTATLLASNGPLSLYADWDGEYLYLAAEGVGSTASWDHFIIVGVDLSTPVSAPWAKTGTVADRTLYLANEDGNNWCGWFDDAESVLSSDVECASGGYLEGIIRLETYLGGPTPDGIYLAVAGYETPDGGELQGQAPAGNGNGHIEDVEYVYFDLTITGIDDGSHPHGLPELFPARPNPTSGGTRIELSLPRPARATLAVYDVLGRKVKTIVARPFYPGRHSLTWDARNELGRRVSPGVYFMRLDTEGYTRIRKVVVIR
jgi:hypothetical protein